MEKCPFTRTDITEFIPTNNPLILHYQNENLGEVKIAQTTAQSIRNGQFEDVKYLIAGICKKLHIEGKEPVLIDTNFCTDGYKEYHPPIDFDDKYTALLKNLYDLFGKNGETFRIISRNHYALGYSDENTFINLMNELFDLKWVKCDKPHRPTSVRVFIYGQCRLTPEGKAQAKGKVKKETPDITQQNTHNSIVNKGSMIINNNSSINEQTQINQSPTKQKISKTPEKPWWKRGDVIIGIIIGIASLIVAITQMTPK